MEWLSEFEAQIMCKNRMIRLESLDGSTMTVYSDRESYGLNVISMTKAEGLIRKGCGAYLEYVVKATVETNEVKDVVVLRDYSEVFLEDLPWLPLEQEVEFQKDLIPGAQPVAKAPYRLASSEMKELMTQQQEILDKGFIRPNVSP
ncbi:uncharacterized protein LOC143581782 [Bidens hawaiensis]|uniref:uncharacterized protein LOC143581782 n=1 Tax=Bidens hawaiensis TaxID=980011 RepID=UPI00404A22C9